MSDGYGWADLAGDLPVHQDEVETAHQGEPSPAVQDKTHGAPRPPEDRGVADDVKYC